MYRGILTLILLAVVGTCGAGTYSTSFTNNENPISEGGNWINGLTVGLDWSDCATAGGVVQARQSNGAGPSYNDSTALLTGNWGSNQVVKVTLYKGNVVESDYPEVEIRLRSSLSPHSCTGYECLYSLRTGADRYIAVVRWNGPFGDFTGVTNVTGLYNITNGSTLKASVVGSEISLYVDGTKVLTASDSTFTNGTPGIGLDHNGPSSEDAGFGFTSFVATDSRPRPPTGLHLP